MGRQRALQRNAARPPRPVQDRLTETKRSKTASARAFKHLKYAEGEIQALVHWRSADSIRIYGRMDEIYQMNARERASTATFTAINASSLPQIDPVRYTVQGTLLMSDLVNIVPRISAAA